MTWRSNTAATTSGGWITSRYAGLGVPSAEIPATGDSGPAYLYNDSVANGAGEYRGVILTLPSAGAFTTFENSALSLVDAPDGIHLATYQGYKDGVIYNNPDETGGEWVITMTIGSEAPSNSQANVSANFSQFSSAVAASSIDPLGSSAVVTATFAQFSANVSASASGEPLNSDAAVAVAFPQFTASVIANNGQVVYYTDPKAILTKTFKSSILFKS